MFVSFSQPVAQARSNWVARVAKQGRGVAPVGRWGLVGEEGVFPAADRAVGAGEEARALLLCRRTYVPCSARGRRSRASLSPTRSA